MSQLLYQRGNSGTGTLPVPNVGDVLYGGPLMPEWRRLDALIIPYKGTHDRQLPNVSVALDSALSTVHELEARLLVLEKATRSEYGSLDQLVSASQLRHEEVGRLVRQLSDRLSAVSHAPITVSRVSNPSLSIDNATQQMSLDLTAKGSYNDLRTQLGQTNIQGAIETIYAQAVRLSDENNVLRDQLARLSAKVDQLSKQ